MARQQALAKLHNRLMVQRDELLRKITEELGEVQQTDTGINDVAEQALQDERSELHAQLAARESRELRDIDHALRLIREGRYGVCEHCEKSIPVARLEAVPFTATCVQCQSDRELRGPAHEHFEEHWGSAAEFERSTSDAELSLQDLDQEPDLD
jgi:DnaK suppressor protein